MLSTEKHCQAWTDEDDSNRMFPFPHEIKGQAIYAYCILRTGQKVTHNLEEELITHVGDHLGKIARPEQIQFVDSLPKTRSGKIMRRLLKARAQGLDEGDTSTLED